MPFPRRATRPPAAFLPPPASPMRGRQSAVGGRQEARRNPSSFQPNAHRPLSTQHSALSTQYPVPPSPTLPVPHSSSLPAARCLLPTSRNAFTLLELLVVMGIIVLLAAILVPVVSQVRMRGYVVSTQGQMQRIAAALDSYFHDFKAYPGPLPNSQLVGQPNAGNSTFTVTTTQTPTPVIKAAQITSSENLVLGLLGILSTPTAPGQPVTYSGLPPAHDVMGLNPLRPASYHYIDYIPEELSFPTGYAYANRLGIMDTTTGTNKLLTDANAQLPVPNGQQPSVNAQAIGNDTQVPEFMDRIPDFMPILYIRANVGIAAPGDGTGIATTDMKSRPAQYDVTQLAPYGFNQVSFTPPIAAGSADYTLPAGMTITTDAAWVAYFMNPAINGQARGKDGFVLISAGADRLYGTKDDIIVTP